MEGRNSDRYLNQYSQQRKYNDYRGPRQPQFPNNSNGNNYRPHNGNRTTKFDNRNYQRDRYNSTPYDRPQHPRFNSYNRPRYGQQRGHHLKDEDDISIPLSPLEVKIGNIINTVRSQCGVTGQLVFIETDIENPTVVLQNAVQSTKSCVLNVALNTATNQYELKLNGELFAETDTQGKQPAKNALCEIVMNKLRKKCFYIIKKKNYEEVTTANSGKKEPVVEVQPAASMEGSKAYQMMLKMGWGGKGLGVKEQGEEKTVAETIVENVTKEGLGSKNILSEIQNILTKFAHSTKVTTLAFDSGFTKEERAQIHNLAAKFNLKSKSEGKNENRRITISKKLGKWDLVKELLRVGLENDSYKLIIPEEFQSLWQED